MGLRVNGTDRGFSGRTVADLLCELGMDPAGPGFAVAVDGEVVPRARWPERALGPGDEVEIVGAVQGG